MYWHDMIDCQWKAAIHQAHMSLCCCGEQAHWQYFSWFKWVCSVGAARVISFPKYPTHFHKFTFCFYLHTFYCSTRQFTCVRANVIEQWCTACWLLWFNELSHSMKIHLESSLFLDIKSFKSDMAISSVPDLLTSHCSTTWEESFLKSHCPELLQGIAPLRWLRIHKALPECPDGLSQEMLCAVVINIEITPVLRWCALPCSKQLVWLSSHSV